MAIQIGELLIKMGADVAQLRTDMAESKTVVRGAMADIEKAAVMARTAFVALTGVASAGALVGIIRGAIDAKARLYDLSLQAGIAVEQLSALAEVGKFANTSAEQIAAAANKLSRALTGVDEDSKGAAQGIQALGLDFAQFKALSPDEKMLAVARAMERFSGEEEKAQVAMLLFGRAGAELLPFLKELAETHKLVAKETTEGARQAKLLQDNFVRLHESGEDLKRHIATELLPSLIAVSEQMKTMREDGSEGSLIADGIRIAFEALSVLGANVVFVLKGVGREIGAIAAQAAALARGDFAGFTAISDAVKEDGRRAREELDAFEQRVLQTRKALDAALPSTGDFARADRLASRPRLKIPGASADDGKDKVTETQRLIAAIRERIAQEELEDQTGAKLTDGQKLALDIMVKLRDAKLKANVAERGLIAGLLEEMLAREQANAAAEADRKQAEQDRQQRESLLESVYRQAESLRAVADAAEDELDTIGKTQRELKDLEIARTLDAAAALRQRAAGLQLADRESMLADLYMRQADALDRVANARARNLQKEDAIKGDALGGARRGLQEYADDIKDVNASAYKLVKDTTAAMEDSFTDFFTTGHFGAKRFVDQLISEFMRLAVVKPLLSSLLGSSFGTSLTGFVGSLFGAGSITGTLSGGGSASGPGLSVPANFPSGAAPRASAQAASGGDVHLNQTLVFQGSGNDRNTLAAAAPVVADMAVARIQDMQRRARI